MNNFYNPYGQTGQTPFNQPQQMTGVKPLQDPPNTQQVLGQAITGKAININALLGCNMTELLNKIISWIEYFKTEIETLKRSIKDVASANGMNTDDIAKMKNKLAALEESLKEE